MARIHHTQAAQAKRLGVMLEVDGDTVIAFKDKNSEVCGYGSKAPEAMADLFQKLGTTTMDIVKSMRGGAKTGRVVSDGSHIEQATPLADRIDAGTATDVELAEVAEELEAARTTGRKPAKKSKTKAAKKGKKKPKFTCTNCGEHKYESDGEEDGGFVCSSCGEEADVEVEEDNGRSVVKKKYKRAYKPFKGKCGDSLAERITAHVMVKHEGDKKYHVDEDKLKAFAKANGVWDPAFQGRNNGLVRMTMRNRLQGKLNRKEIKLDDIKWPA